MQTLPLPDRGAVTTITLDRPEKKNAINATMWAELKAVLGEIGASDSVRVVVLTGSGGAFCSGTDLDELGEGLKRHVLSEMRVVTDVVLALQELPQPTIAKVGGDAIGAGCNLAFTCDLTVASRPARFAEIFSRRGLSIDSGGTWLLPRLVGLNKAKEIALFGDMLSASEALELGLLNRVVPAEELDAFVDGWADRLASGPPIALAQTKRMLNLSVQGTFHEALHHEAAAQTICLMGADATEAIRSFAEKRPAQKA
jgi:2-(1,2-epoxy-1,2-dihydrophenyl)acetyl-CoA isomerase